MSEYELITFQIIQQLNIQCAQNHKFDIHIQNEIIILFPHQPPTRTEQREEYEFVKSPTSTTNKHATKSFSSITFLQKQINDF